MNGPQIPFAPNRRYPDPAVVALTPEFLKYRVYSSSIEQLASGCRWNEGPAAGLRAPDTARHPH